MVAIGWGRDGESLSGEAQKAKMGEPLSESFQLSAAIMNSIYPVFTTNKSQNTTHLI